MATIDNSSEQSRVGRKKRAEARERLLNGLAAGACEYFQKKAWEDLRNVEPRDRLFFWEKFMQYLAPKLQTEKQETEIKGSHFPCKTSIHEYHFLLSFTLSHDAQYGRVIQNSIVTHQSTRHTMTTKV